ncbi:hypothetical protein [Tenacibaculum sp. M341]|uniref:hypothetical protein n=1 Tax=Tenacibaculum sp. M341 TaxID=2530339 RepID=UPI001047F859|nr:hypothetical protein [Tenacibaculum sp. M341]TCI92310.1 hypothetical protein EYW44_09010 [Tenacibaculum sp. M341]
MKNFIKSSLLVAFVATSSIFTSCSNNENEGLTPPDPTVGGEYQITVNPTNAGSADRSVEIVAAANDLVTVRVNYTGDKKMRRAYITRNDFSNNDGPQAYFYPTAVQKSDGSIDIDGDDKDDFVFDLQFDTPQNINEVVQYIIWTTNDKGDFRDISDSNSIDDDAYGTITIKAGANATGSSTSFKSFSQTILAAPLASGASESFVSLFDEKTHKINEGDETLALWDFGYFYGTSTEASFYSVYDYPKVFEKNGMGGLHVSEFVGTTLTELNRCYFKASSKTAADFDAANSASDLENTLTTADAERVQNLSVGDVVEFLDQYGNKGLIKVTAITPGNGSSGKITFDVKVQVNAIPVMP